MITYFQIITNLLMPIGAAALYLGCFFFSRMQTRERFKYFNFFLLSFALYLSLRPVQLGIGPYPMPFWICQFRHFLLNAVCAPLAYLALCSFSQRPHQEKVRKAFLGGITLGLLYCVMNALGTHSSYVLLDLGPLQFHDNLTPSGLGPWYGREFTTLIQCLMSIIFFISPSILCIKSKDLKNKRQYLFAIGLFIFGFAYLMGTLSHLWGIYYLTAAVSALLLSKAVFEEVQQVRQHITSASSLIREELLDALLTTQGSKDKLKKLFSFIGCETLPEHFIILELDKSDNSNDFHEKASEYLRKRNDQNHYHIFCLSQERIAIACQNVNRLDLANFTEDLRRHFSEDKVSVGVSYSSENLCEAYRESLMALYRAQALGGDLVVIFSPVKAQIKNDNCPHKQQVELIQMVLELRSDELEDKINSFVQNLIKSCKMDLFKIKLHLQGIPVLLRSNCMDKSIDPEETQDFDQSQTAKLLKIKEISELTDWIKETTSVYLEMIRSSQQKPEHSQIKRVKDYIQSNYKESISLEKAATIACLSASHFRRVFKKECGVSFSQYLTAQRIIQAKLSLIDLQKPISDIAYELGFKDSNYFSTVFRKSEGISPREFRQNHI